MAFWNVLQWNLCRLTFSTCVYVSFPLPPPAPPSIVNGVFSGNLRTPWSVRIADKKAEKVFPPNSVWQASLMKYGNFCRTSVTLQKLPIRLMETNYILLDMLSSFWNRKEKNTQKPLTGRSIPTLCHLLQSISATWELSWLLFVWWSVCLHTCTCVCVLTGMCEPVCAGLCCYLCMHIITF